MRATGSALSGALLAALIAGVIVVAGGAALGVAPHVELSDSMAPTLRAGDVLWLDRIAASDAKVGDVVAFDDPDRHAVVLHRVQRIRADRDRLAFTTRGDANNASERWSVPRDGRLGRYVGVRIPEAGRAVSALAGVALAVIAAVSGFLLAALALRRIWS
ncbi:MAG TPA: signal peptidase I [Solirubrobacteraceae bacterium]